MNSLENGRIPQRMSVTPWTHAQKSVMSEVRSPVLWFKGGGISFVAEASMGQRY